MSTQCNRIRWTAAACPGRPRKLGITADSRWPHKQQRSHISRIQAVSVVTQQHQSVYRSNPLFKAPSAPRAPAFEQKGRHRGPVRPCPCLAAESPNSGQQPAMGEIPEKSGVVIVGGGPAGLAAALMFARRGWKNITVLEQQESVTYADPDRSYVYCIDGRGRRFVERYGMFPPLVDGSVSTQTMAINLVEPSGSVKERSMSIKDDTKVTHWLPRRAFMSLLADALAADPQAAREVQLLPASQATRLERGPGGNTLLVTVEPSSSSSSGAPGRAPRQLEARLVLGCDGIKSLVRTTLDSWAPGAFSVQQYPSLSTGIRYKVLQLPPNPTTADGRVLPNPSFAVLVGRPTKLLPGAPAMRLGLLPVRDPAANRTANLNVLPDHPVWQVKDADRLYDVFQDAFPQMNWRELVPQPVMAQFAGSRGGTFPAPQYCSSLTWQLGAGQAGVVLLGDAAHCFPPDLGQGVNASLEDVVVLEEVLEQVGDKLGPALITYQQQRQDDTAALCRLVQVGYPLQYKQYPWRQKWWTVTFSFQLLLSKVLPFLVAPPIFMVVQDASRSYSQIWRDAQRSAGVVRGIATVLAVALVVAVARLMTSGTPA